jgi:hypothetical protein
MDDNIETDKVTFDLYVSNDYVALTIIKKTSLVL